MPCALHHIPNGALWTPEEIAKRKTEIDQRSGGTPSALTWDLVESLPVFKENKTQDGEWREHIEANEASTANIDAAGIETLW